MIAHISGTSSFARTATYLEKGHGDPAPNRVLWVEPRGGASRDLLTAAGDMEDLAQYSSNVETPGYHLILAFDPDDEVGKEEMLYVREQVHDALGFQGLMSTVVSHGDAYYPHFHELICRVDYWTGTAVDPSFPYYKIEQRLRELERKMGLRETPGRHGRLPDQEFRRKYDWTWLSKEDKRYARAALRGSTSWKDLETRLSRRNLGLRLDRNNLILVRGASSVRAGTIQRGTSLKKMERRMGQPFADYALSQRKGEKSRATSPVREGTTANDMGAEASVGDVVSAEVQEVLKLARDLARIEQEQKAAAEAVGAASRMELWASQLDDLSARTVDARTAMERLLRQVYQRPKLASARYQMLSATEGHRAAGDKLREHPRWFGAPTRMGQSAEGELILQEAATRGDEYGALLHAVREVREDLLSEGLIDRSGRGRGRGRGADDRGGDISPHSGIEGRIAGDRMTNRLGEERAIEVKATMEQEAEGQAQWKSPELPVALAQELSDRRAMLSRTPIAGWREAGEHLRMEIQRRLEQLRAGERRLVHRAVLQDARLRASESVARIVTPERSRARSSIHR